MPVISVKMLSGRTAEQKRQLVDALTRGFTETCGTHPDGVQILIEEIDAANWGQGGVLISERK